MKKSKGKANPKVTRKCWKEKSRISKVINKKPKTYHQGMKTQEKAEFFNS